MKRQFHFPFFYWCVCLALCLVVVLSQTAIAQNPYGDPSARVARLSYIQGDVSLQPGGEEDWVWASPNRPLTTADSLWSGRNSRAELHIGSTAIRIAPDTALSFLNLDDSTVQIELNAGTLNLRVRNLYPDDIFEIDTPNIAFTLLRRGDYRITVDPDGSFTTVTVRDGQGQVTGGGEAFLVDADSQVQVSGTEYISYDVYDLPPRDTFDRWADTRDLQESRSVSVRYVSPELTGYEDLDRDGDWVEDRNLGSVWTPTRVSSDWAPYRDGHWAWVDPWGWTWVDDAPFGFVTSHYGRWAFLNNGPSSGRWAWVPPRRDQTNAYNQPRPVYSPALVIFVSNPSRDIGGSGGVAWVPLGPGEVYVPSYRASPTYVTQVNITNTVVLQPVITRAVNNPEQTRPFANQRVAGAITAVPRTAFVNAQPVARVAVKVDSIAAAAATPAPSAPVAPVKASVVTGSAAATKPAAPASQPPAAVVSRPVVAKVAPPPPPVAFARKEQALAANPGKPLDTRTEQTLRAAAPVVAPPVKTAPPATVVKPAAEVPKKPQPAISPNVAKQEHPATPATGAPPPGQQRAEMARQQAAQQQAEKEKAQQLAAQLQAEKEKAQQEAALAKQQAAQQQAEKEKAQQLAAQQQAEKEKAQREAALAKQQAAQQQAEKERAQQLAAQLQAEKEKAQQLAAQQQAEKEKAQQLAAQQQADRGRGRDRQQIAQAEPPANPPGKQPNAGRPQANAPAAAPMRVPENVQAARLISQPKLNVPANVQDIHGVVRMRVLIGADGKVKSAAVLGGPQGGPPPLQALALENVRQRVYQPTMANGVPVEVETEVSIKF